MYTTLKFVHVLASIVWIGSGVALLTVTAGMVRARDYAGVAALGRQSEKLGTRLFAPSAMITLVAGVAMVIVGDLSFASAWIVIGLVGVAVSFVLGAVLGERAQAQLREALASQGIGVSTAGDSPAAGATSAAGGTPDDVITQPTIDHAVVDVARRRLMTVSTIDLMVLTVVVWAMVAKPGL